MGRGDWHVFTTLRSRSGENQAGVLWERRAEALGQPCFEALGKDRAGEVV